MRPLKTIVPETISHKPAFVLIPQLFGVFAGSIFGRLAAQSLRRTSATAVLFGPCGQMATSCETSQLSTVLWSKLFFTQWFEIARTFQAEFVMH